MSGEEWLRAWAQEHALLLDIAVPALVVLALAIRAIWWLRHNDVHEAIGDLMQPAPAAAAAPAARPIDPRTMRVGRWVLAVLGVTAIGLAATFSWIEYEWMGAEIVRAPFLDSSTAAGTVTARYRVTSTTRPPFTAAFFYTPRGGSMVGVDESMRRTRVLEIHRGDPLRYREYSRSTSRDPRGWPLIEFDAALGAAFGGLFLLFAFKMHP